MLRRGLAAANETVIRAARVSGTARALGNDPGLGAAGTSRPSAIWRSCAVPHDWGSAPLFGDLARSARGRTQGHASSAVWSTGIRPGDTQQRLRELSAFGHEFEQGLLDVLVGHPKFASTRRGVCGEQS